MKIQIVAGVLALSFALCMMGCGTRDENSEESDVHDPTVTAATVTFRRTSGSGDSRTSTTTAAPVTTKRSKDWGVDTSKIVTSSQVDGYSMTADAREYSYSNKDIIHLTIAGTAKEEFQFVDSPVMERLDGDEWVPYHYYDTPGNIVRVLVTSKPESPCMTTGLFLEAFKEEVKTGLYRITMTIMDRPVSVVVMLTP